MTTRVAVAGARGRMGTELLAARDAVAGVVVTAALLRPGSDAAGLGGAAGGLLVADAPDALAGAVDVVVDFTAPAATAALAAWCAAHGVALVSGATGLDEAAETALAAAAERVPVYHARNMSLGVHALLRALPILLATLPGCDVEIVETHHRGKRDAPSGTAAAIAEAVAAARGATLAGSATFGRQGIAPRAAGEIGIHAVRGGGNPGEHVVVLAGEGEEVRLAHRSFGRRAYAEGALRAAAFVHGRPPGRYGPNDLLG